MFSFEERSKLDMRYHDTIYYKIAIASKPRSKPNAVLFFPKQKTIDYYFLSCRYQLSDEYLDALEATNQLVDGLQTVDRITKLKQSETAAKELYLSKLPPVPKKV